MKLDTNMTQGKPMRLLTVFALPLMFGNLFQQLYTVVDIAVIGRGIGMDALAALGCVDWLNWMMIGIAQRFTQGFSVRIAQKYGEGIRVNALCPGFFLTEQNRALLTNPDGSKTARGKLILQNTPMNKWGNPEDLQGALIYLASDASRFVTGTTTIVDGGFDAFSGV